MKFKSHTNVVYACPSHVIFCPKYRRTVLVQGVDVRLTAIVHEVAAATESEVLELAVLPDHVHLLLGVDPQCGIHRLVKRITGRSSRLLRLEFPWLTRRLPTLWTNASFVSTTGGAPRAVITAYLDSQKRRER